MARTVAGDATVVINFADTETSNTISASGNKTSLGVNERINYGTAPAVARQWGRSALSLAGSATTLDLTALTGPRGTETFASVRLVYIKNNASTAGHNLTVGAAASDAWVAPLGGTAPTVSVPPGGRLLLDNPDTTAWAVSGSAKNLKLDPGANTITVDVLIVGS